MMEGNDTLLSGDELATQSGLDTAQINRFVELGLIEGPDDKGCFQGGHVTRLRLISALLNSGLSLNSLGRAVASKQLSFEFAGQMLADPVALSSIRVEDACAEAGVDYETFARLMLALGFSSPPRNSAMREDMREFLAIFATVVGLGIPADIAMRTLRSFAMSLRRVAEASRSLFREYVESPLLEQGLSPSEMFARAAPLRVKMQTVGYRSAYLLQRRLYEEAVFGNLIARFEDILEQHEDARPATFPRRTIGFVDMSGFTERTEAEGDANAAGLGLALIELVQAEVSRNGGELVKALGDGAMLQFRRADDAARAALNIVAAARHRNLPPVRAGIATGPVISQDGDYYGRCVNRAARLLGAARPGEVVASSEVMESVQDGSLHFRPLGAVSLKGFRDTVAIYSVEQVPTMGITVGDKSAVQNP